jgi:hypothetical protein
MVALSLRFARSDLPFCLFAQTLTFVAFNKVRVRLRPRAMLACYLSSSLSQPG